jgi:DNA mismatch repair protein MutS2
MVQLQQKREEAEKAREEALRSQHEADQQRLEYEHRVAELERSAHEEALLKDMRGRLQPGDHVQVPRFDKPGRIVRVDHKRNVAVVSLGLGQWEVPLDDIFPPAP